MESTSNLICSYCSKHLKTNAALNRHEKVHIINQKICNECPGEIFITKNDYLAHLNLVHNNKTIESFICSECGKQFKSKSELNTHTNSKCGTLKLYKCKVCLQELMNPGSLHNHMLKHKGGPSFMCRFCAKLFLTAGQLKVHERIHTQEKPFVCNICGKGFCHRQSLITHSTLHTGIKPYSCENCGHAFSCVGNLLKHRKTHIECGLVISTSHRVTNPFTKMKVKVNTPISAKLKVIEKQKQVQQPLDGPESTDEIETSGDSKKNEVNKEVKHSSDQHKLLDTNVQPNYSLVHRKFIESLDRNTNHRKSKHLNDVQNKMQSTKLEREEIMFSNTSRQDANKDATQYQDRAQCRGYDKNYEEHQKNCISNSINCTKTIRRHIIYQEDTDKTYKCSCCQESFSNQNDRKIHQIRAHAELLTCQDCDKSFTNPDSLRTHRNTFHRCVLRKTYTYICEYCGKQFKQKSALILHKENKCADGPQISCEVCHRKFSSIHVRKSHMRIHSSEKKIFCKFCSKTFHWKGQLKIHERRHTGEKPFTCLYCPKAFAYRESLITHSSLHTGIKPHLCEACGSRFSCVGNLIKHRTTHANTCGVWYSKIKNAADAI